MTGTELNAVIINIQDVFDLIHDIQPHDAKLFFEYFQAEANKTRNDTHETQNSTQNGRDGESTAELSSTQDNNNHVCNDEINQERRKLIPNNTNENDNIAPSIELSSMRDNAHTKSFKINIQTESKGIKTLKTKCSKYTTIKRVKQIIIHELNKNNIDNIELQYNGNSMDNDSILADYNIVDAKHLIELKYKRFCKCASNINSDNNDNSVVVIRYELKDKLIHAISVPRITSIGCLKRQIRQKHKITPIYDIQLYYGNQQLIDSFTINSCGIVNNGCITVKYIKRISYTLACMIGFSRPFYIAIILIESLNTQDRQKCINPETEYYYGNPISIHTFIMFFSIASLLYSIIVPACIWPIFGRNNAPLIRFYNVFIWCFCTLGGIIGLIMIFNDSIPKECLQSKSGYLLIIWVIIHNLLGIPLFIVKGSWYLYRASYDLICEYASTLIASLILLVNFILDWLPFFALIQDLSINECNKDFVRLLLCIGWIGKLVYTVVIIYAKMIRNNKGIKYTIYCACFWFQFLLGLSGLLLTHTFGSGIPGPCFGSNLGILLQIWCYSQIIIAVIMRIIIVRHGPSRSISICETIVAYLGCVCTLIILSIPILSLLGHYVFTEPKCVEISKSLIDISQYLLIIGSSDMVFNIIIPLSITAAFRNNTGILLPLIIGFIYAMYSIIIGAIGLHTIEQNTLTKECSQTFMGIIFQINCYYHTVFGSLLLIICAIIFIYYVKPNQKILIARMVSGFLLFIGLITLFMNGILAIIQPFKDDYNVYSNEPNECRTNWFKIFLRIGGSSQISMFFVACFAGWYAHVIHDCYPVIFPGLMCLFVLGWSIYGIMMYHTNYLSHQCRMIKLSIHMVIYSYTNIFIICSTIFLLSL